MALRIETFSDAKGGNTFFKAIGHPLAARKAAEFFVGLRAGPVALYDPLGLATALAEIHDLNDLNLAGVYVQDLADLGKAVLGQSTRPVTDLKAAEAETVLVVAFDAARLIDHIRHLLPAGARVTSLDVLRLPDDMLTDRRNYLNKLNFATNLVFFREAGGQHTRLVTVNYWSAFGAKDPEIWCCLLGQDGSPLAEWREALPGPNGAVVIDSAEIRDRFQLAEFTGQLFLHVVRIAGHDIVKYALDTYGDDATVLSATHDANSWPAELYAGVPAPQEGERVVLWVQNSHPKPIPAGGIGLNRMGRSEVAWLQREVPGYGVFALDIAELLPEARWPQQIEVRAGKHFVRPRYEVFAANGRSRIAHANVERVDLVPDSRIPDLSNLMGKGFILPAPVLPAERFRSIVLPTPMATCQESLPVAALIYDPQGRQIGSKRLGNLPRSHESAFDAGAILAESRQDPGSNGPGSDDPGSDGFAGAWGHVELVYDFADGGAADGWLHALFRYEDKVSGHGAETSFGAHMFNTVLTYQGEPQSYGGRPPGLSTRLFLRLGRSPCETICHLIYPASTPWHPTSSTQLILFDAEGKEVTTRAVEIPCGGSLLWRVSEIFDAGALAAAGESSYVIVRDGTCRLFGYHGLVNGEISFSLDHMFGF